MTNDGATVVLVTGGRSPVALELVRLFGRAGARVLVAESSGGYLCQASRYVGEYVWVPSPRYRTCEYIDSLLEIILGEQVDLLVPTCEEIFYISKFRERLAARCRVLAPEFGLIKSLHRKDSFLELAGALGLAVPKSGLLGETDRVVLKPVYSRFGGETKIVSKRELDSFRDENRAWVVQEYLEGAEYHSYALTEKGEVLANVVYRSLANEHGTGPSLAFRAVENAAIENWIQRFVKGVGFSGQIAFDFIVDADGEARAIECNPRATSGLHLLAGVEGLYEAFLDGSSVTVRPDSLGSKGLRLPCTLLGKAGDFEDVIFRKDDPWPAFAQVATLAYFAAKALLNRSRLAEAMVDDFRWNGEAIG